MAQKDKITAEITQYASFFNETESEDEQTNSLLKEIEDQANKSSVYLVEMKPMGLRDEGVGKKYMININCESQMEQLANFMYHIENSSKLLTIDRYQISPKSKDSSLVKCNMVVTKIIMP